MKRIVLVACASSFESHGQIVTSLVDTMREIGGYSLDVLTSYATYGNLKNEYADAERSVYELLKKKKYDGAILESNIGREDMLHGFEKILRDNGTPYVAVNTEILDCPSYCQDSYVAVNDVIDHLVCEHKLTKINLVIRNSTIGNGDQILRAYREILEKNGIEVDEGRVFESLVGIEEGEMLFDDFKARGKDDAEAVILFHDVNAIGLIGAYEKNGIKVPEDVKVVSLHYSTNSMLHKPDITGVAVEDAVNARAAMFGLHALIEGKEVQLRNYNDARVIYGKSCGCEEKNLDTYHHNSSKNVVIAKISNASQIRAMMEYNQALHNISSIDELGVAIENMFDRIGCGEFCVCINQKDLKYLTEAYEKHVTSFDNPFDDNMCIIASNDRRIIDCGIKEFATKEVTPVESLAGEFNIILPIHVGAEVFGYIIVKNSLFPVTVYNYRICHESIGSSMEELHRQVVLNGTIEELNRLRLMDYMTGTYNKSGLDYFSKKYFADQDSIVAMIDVDGLKYINDRYGHIQGDVVIQICADSIIKNVHNDDVVIRYGGDEFMVLSLHTDMEFWDECQGFINAEISRSISKRNLEYDFGISFGYSKFIANIDKQADAIKRSDQLMYENKIERKAVRES